MAKGSSQAQAAKNGSPGAKKAAWKGINLKQKSPSRPASVNSQESRKSTHTIASIEKPGSVASPLTTEFEPSSPRNNNSNKEEPPPKVDAIEMDPNQTEPATAAAKSNETTTNDIAAIPVENGDSTKDEDDGASTPRAMSRRSSFTALDSASEVFEDAFDDHDDYFDDVPTFDEQFKEKDQMHTALSTIGKNVDDDAVRKEEHGENRTTVDEIESLQVAEAPSSSPSPSAAPTPSIMQQTKQQGQNYAVSNDKDDDGGARKNEEKTTKPGTAKAATEAIDVQEKNDKSEESIKAAQPTANDVTQDNAHPSKATQEQERLSDDAQDDQTSSDHSHNINSDSNIKASLAESGDIDPWRSPDQDNAISSQQSNLTEMEREQNHRVADVLADLENSASNFQSRFEFPTVDIDVARGNGDGGHDGDINEKSPVLDHHVNADSGVFDAKSSEEKSEPTRNTSFSDSVDRKELEMNQHDRLGTLLPAMEDSARETIAVHNQNKMSVDNTSITSEDQHRAARSNEFEHPIEDPIDLDMFRDNVISIPTIDPKSIPINYLTPREQEEADEPVREGMRNLFDNKFMKAKNIFQSKANVEPLYALGLGAMAFIKAMMTYQESDVEVAMSTLATAYTIAKAQIDNTSFKKPLKDAVSQYFSSMLSRNNSSGLPNNPAPITRSNSAGQPRELPVFLPNSILRAHVIKAECCLLMSILQLSQESVVNYLKCGLNLRRAYNSYSVVWQEYKRMGQEYTKYMDRDTVSAIQFGIGAVHLILSSMPAKILKVFSTLGWQSDKQLGFALLKLCLEGRGIRSPLASLTLLSYYSVLTSFAPQIYAKELMGPAIECLLDAQKSHPSSCFFLFFAARIARVARNIPLSTQSFNFAVESSRGEWAETAMKQMADYEIGFNLALQLDWEGAAAYFEQLSREKYWSPAFSRYFVGACREMLGQRTECILAFAEVPQLAKEQQGRKTYIDAHVQKKVEFFQKSGYQDMDFSLPGLEILLVWNAFEQMEPEALEKCLEMVHRTLELIYEREKMEYTIRLRELVPNSTPPDYYDQRAVLLLTKASLLNALGRYSEGIAHLNWVMDHKDNIKHETWALPFAYWEAGVTSWGLGNIKKSRKLWQMALSCNKYDFEYRMAVRLSLALARCDEIGIPYAEPQQKKGQTTNGRKRMPITDP